MFDSGRNNNKFTKIFQAGSRAGMIWNLSKIGIFAGKIGEALAGNVCSRGRILRESRL